METDIIHLKELMQLELKNVQLQIDNSKEREKYQTELNELHFNRLNDEYGTIKDMKNTFVSGELFNSEINKLHAMLNSKDAELSKRLSAIEKIAYIGIGALAVVQIGIQFLK